MDKEWTTVEVLSQSRHDWLNKIQLIKGNMELNKLDHVKAVIDEIVIEAQNEARLTNLKMPQFSEFILTANWRNHPFHCEFEVIDILQGSEVIDEIMYNWTRSYFEIVNKNLDFLSENTLAIGVCKNKSGFMRFSFDLQGNIKDISELYSFLDVSLTDHQSIDRCESSDEEFRFKMDINIEL